MSLNPEPLADPRDEVACCNPDAKSIHFFARNGFLMRVGFLIRNYSYDLGK